MVDWWWIFTLYPYVIRLVEFLDGGLPSMGSSVWGREGRFGYYNGQPPLGIEKAVRLVEADKDVWEVAARYRAENSAKLGI
jgi:hypothetical protein